MLSVHYIDLAPNPFVIVHATVSGLNGDQATTYLGKIHTSDIKSFELGNLTDNFDLETLVLKTRTSNSLIPFDRLNFDDTSFEESIDALKKSVTS